MHAQLLDQLALAGDAIQIANQQNAQQQLWINRRTAHIAVTLFQLLTHKGEADVFVDEPQKMVFWNLIFEPEVIKQRFGTGVLSHHDQQPSENGD